MRSTNLKYKNKKDKKPMHRHLDDRDRKILSDDISFSRKFIFLYIQRFDF